MASSGTQRRSTAKQASRTSQAPHSIMTGMICCNAPFNGEFGSWDVAGTQLVMTCMFGYTTSLNGEVCLWGISDVNLICVLFDYATSFKGDASSWDVAGATVN
jgi:hypothetical protein